MEAFTDVHCGTVDTCSDESEEERQTCSDPDLSHIHSGFHQIVLEGIKGASGFIALDDIEYTTGVNCDGQLVDPKPGEMHRWRKQILKMDGLLHADVLRRFKIGCY